MREDRFPDTNHYMGLQGVSLSGLRSIAANLPRIAKIDMDDYLGYFNRRLFLYRTSGPKRSFGSKTSPSHRFLDFDKDWKGR